MQAVILAAGQGLRLRPLTESTPKALLLIAGKPLIDYTITALPEVITELIIVIGHLGDQIRAHVGENVRGIPVTYIEQSPLAGTGAALALAEPLLHDDFLVVNGDDLYTKEDLTELLDSPISLLAWEGPRQVEYGIIADDNHCLVRFSPNSSTINCGAYHLSMAYFTVPVAPITVHGGTEYSLPHTLVQLAETHDIKIIVTKKWLPVGTPEQYETAQGYTVKD
jgi:UDP-N-acetylglucosamine diphosphorylase / glucose-1-phosphate thymidylyltransferase / UDP-N-acetylgalactosamine diphosphorylase / glucosamine-1-phosphate N-acetyltransferase / galactosamine-1-phosphate N-acetyltransferase